MCHFTSNHLCVMHSIPNFVDSLFGETAESIKKAKAIKKKAKKKSEPKDYSMFDTDAPSIFDDPLNADKYLMLCC